MVDHFQKERRREGEIPFQGKHASLLKMDMLIENAHKFVLESSTKKV
jgi:hypothetical protein